MHQAMARFNGLKHIQPQISAGTKTVEDYKYPLDCLSFPFLILEIIGSAKRYLLL
jgi:hypothetical protein